MSRLSDMLRQQIDSLESQLTRGEKHQCRYCLYHACGGTGKCRCSCGQIRKERAIHLERLRMLAEAIDTGEIPTIEDNSSDESGKEPG